MKGLAVGPKLNRKKRLGIHSPIFCDALMDLVRSGAVNNRNKEVFYEKSITYHACGSATLLDWLDNNPAVEFHPIDKVFDPLTISRNPGFVAMIPAEKIDITGKITLPGGLESIGSSPVEVHALLSGAKRSKGGCTIVGLPSRDHHERPNIVLSVEGLKRRLDFRQAIDYVVTEQGVASLSGLTLRESAQALIEIAHCEDRDQLTAAAKRTNILYEDQVYLPGNACQYPAHIFRCNNFKGGIDICFRPIKPSDEEEMRRLFYRFTDESVYYRYFSRLKSMPHTKMQAYVNIDWEKAMSIVGIFGKSEHGSIVSEARYVVDADEQWAEVAFIVDESFQRVGICSYVFRLLIELARNNGIKGFWAEVLRRNIAMMKVFEKSGLPIQKKVENTVIHVSMPLHPEQKGIQ